MYKENILKERFYSNIDELYKEVKEDITLMISDYSRNGVDLKMPSGVVSKSTDGKGDPVVEIDLAALPELRVGDVRGSDGWIVENDIVDWMDGASMEVVKDIIKNNMDNMVEKMGQPGVLGVWVEKEPQLWSAVVSNEGYATVVETFQSKEAAKEGLKELETKAGYHIVKGTQMWNKSIGKIEEDQE